MNADELPVPMGVRVDTGKVCPPLTSEEVARIASPGPAVVTSRAVAAARVDSVTVYAPDSSVDDPNDLTQTGWAVVFASDADAAIKQQLQPLLDLRAKQVAKGAIPGGPPLFRVFEGTDPNTGGILLSPDGTPQEAEDWAGQHGVSLNYAVVPKKVPYYC